MKLSIIIPTLNESEFLSRTTKAVRENSRSKELHEIIVVDCGSTDGTRELAERLDVTLVAYDKNICGRSFPLNSGAKKARGDVLLFLDADTIPPHGFDELIEDALEDERNVGGAFEFSLEGKEFSLRVVELLNRIRYRIRYRFFGDQGIFVRKDVFRRVGGYPEVPILEASEFCERIARVGRLVLIKKDIKTSPRRFIEGGVFKVLLSDIKILLLDLLGMPLERYARKYWGKNAQDKSNDLSY